jgi:hypothetical protein
MAFVSVWVDADIVDRARIFYQLQSKTILLLLIYLNKSKNRRKKSGVYNQAFAAMSAPEAANK